MKTLNFSISINAPAEKVWKALWEDSTYRQWTAVFAEGSYAESDWQEGSKIYFLAPKGGMYSVIEKKIPNEQMIFKHLGEIKNGVEEPKDWGGGRERYFLEAKDQQTELRVELDSVPEFESYFQEKFPECLKLVKAISEQ
ncbi:MAG: hypothetical protein K0S09_3034 [Sphingobacteriaceae bacterium]|jgi:hypothetical protein|nr:hypothetical protein [Sphingobacteriaceae bacterium]